MIAISVEREGIMFELTMQGHAEYAEAGKDIVCAAASMLFCLACERAGHLCDTPQVERRSGYGRLCCKVEDMETVTALETVLSGFEMLARQFPDHVKVEGSVEICPF